MEKCTLLLTIGLTLLIISTVTLGILHFSASTNSRRLVISKISMDSVSLTLSEKKHVIISSYSNFSYEILSSKGVVKTANNVSNADILLAPGNYTLKIENFNNFKINVYISIVGEGELQKFVLLSYAFMVAFFIGAILTVVSLGILLWNRKKEEKIYMRY